MSRSWPIKDNITPKSAGSVETNDFLLKMRCVLPTELRLNWTIKSKKERAPLCGDLMVIYLYRD